MNVKKILSILAVVSFIAILFSSCRSRDKCPGVGQIEAVNVENIG
jgi:hypothetical protein